MANKVLDDLERELAGEIDDLWRRLDRKARELENVRAAKRHEMRTPLRIRIEFENSLGVKAQIR